MGEKTSKSPSLSKDAEFIIKQIEKTCKDDPNAVDFKVFVVKKLDLVSQEMQNIRERVSGHSGQIKALFAFIVILGAIIAAGVIL